MAEPLFNQWYAWPYLIAPATAAMYVANSHVKIMRSFVASPQLHVSALQNPAMIGGPFINYDASRVNDIKALLDRTEREQAHLLKFAEAVRELDQMVTGEATGYSLEPLYARVPDILKGYVELVYDLNNYPSIRFIEGLLYRSPYYNPAAQQIALSLTEQDERPFVFSTPRLEGDGRLILNLPLRAAALDELFAMKETPQPYAQIKERLGIGEADDELFATLFAAQGPRPREPYTGDGVRIRYLGHACLLVQTKDVSILTDPVISYEYGGGSDHYTYADLPEQIDYVLITHNHQDHCMLETLLQIRHKTKALIVPKSNSGVLADPSLKFVLQHAGFDNVREIDEMERIEVAGGAITGLPFLGEHGDLNIRSKIAYLLSLKGKTMLCAADSNNIEPRLYDHVHAAVGDVDILFLGMECEGAPLSWAYGALLTKPLARKMDQSRRFDGSNCDKAASIVDRLRPRAVYVYAMGQEPWLSYVTSIKYTPESRPLVESEALIRSCQSQGRAAERLYYQKELFL
jgi:L-ascorbate metabolism protein UlaG (beta-lactamase superfamily)